MDINAIAKRAATKRNNKTKRELPLLAAMDAIPNDWLTTPDEQQARIERQHAESAAKFQEMERDDDERAIQAARFKSIVQSLLSEDQFANVERSAQHIAHLPAVYALDYWRGVLAKIDPQYCPHAQNGHAIFRDGRKCPICGHWYHG